MIDGKPVGGWGQLSYTVERVNLNAGYGIEDVEDRLRNQTPFVNGIYTMRRLPINFALEVDWIDTKSASGETEDNITINFAARYNFFLGLR